MPPKKRDPEATRQAILDAAESLFLENGFGKTALSAIAKHAGVTKSLIHHHFESKENLWQQVKKRRFTGYAQHQMEMLSRSAPTMSLLTDSICAFFGYLKENPQMVRIFAWMFLENDNTECAEMERELVKAGVEKLKIAQEQGIISGVIDARFILFFFIGVTKHWFQARNDFILDFGTENLPEDLDAVYLEAILTLFRNGLSPR